MSKRGDALDIGGCMAVIGASIANAMNESCYTGKSKTYIHQREDARRFIFQKRNLESFLATYHISHLVNPGYIRKATKAMIRGEKPPLERLIRTEAIKDGTQD